MTVAQMNAFQAAVYALVDGATDLLVVDHVIQNPPAEFIRLDGFGISDLSPKNGEIARHAFEVHYFGQIKGQKRAKEVMAAIHTALMAGAVLGTSLGHQLLDIDTGDDGAVVHARSRYTAIL